MKQQSFNLIYDDQDILVVEKLKAFNSQPSDHSEKEGFYEFVGRAMGKNLLPVHRLDREVLGLMIFACTKSAAESLSRQFKERTVKKTYFAWVHGTVSKDKDHLTHYLLKNPKNNRVTVFPKPTPNAKMAELEYVCVAREQNKSLLKVNLLTGRSHQIRAQLSKIGHAIIGDHKYSKQVSETRRAHFEGLPIQLRSARLEVLHPKSKERLSWELKIDKESFPL